MSRWLIEGWDQEEGAGQDETSTPRIEMTAMPAVSMEVLDALRTLGVPMDDEDPGRSATSDPVVWQLLAHCLEEMGEDRGAQRCYRRAARNLVRSSRPESERAFEPLPFAVFRPIRDGRSH